MIPPDATFLNTGLPILGLAALAPLLPMLTVPRATRSQRALAIGMVMAALVMLATGAGLVLGLMALGGTSLADLWRIDAPGLIRSTLTRAGSTALIWAPILALVWFAKAQGVETRRGEDMVKQQGS